MYGIFVSVKSGFLKHYCKEHGRTNHTPCNGEGNKIIFKVIYDTLNMILFPSDVRLSWTVWRKYLGLMVNFSNTT